MFTLATVALGYVQAMDTVGRVLACNKIHLNSCHEIRMPSNILFISTVYFCTYFIDNFSGFFCSSIVVIKDLGVHIVNLLLLFP